MRIPAVVVVPLLVACAASPALARHGGLYLELAPSFGVYDTKEVIVENGDSGGGDFPEASFVPAVKVGVNLFGWAGVEGHITGHYWGIGEDPGGAAYVGGVFRLTPLEVLTYVLPDTVQLPSIFPPGPVSWHDRPFDLGISVGGGYSLLGEDYAYQGSYFQWGFDLKWFLTPNFALGLDFPFRHMMYEPFRYADYGNAKGFCTDGADAYGYAGNVKIPVTPQPDRGLFSGVEVNAADQSSKCGDPAPSALFFAPALTIAGVFDFGI